MKRLLLSGSLLAATVLLVGCGGPSQSGTSFRLTATSSRVGKAVFTLRCTPDGGNVDHPRRACAAIARDPRLLLHPSPLVDPLVCRRNGISPWGITIEGRFQGRPLFVRTLAVCWSPKLALLDALGIAHTLRKHLVCSRGTRGSPRGLRRCTLTARLPIVESAAMRIVRTAPPPSRGPASGVADVAFLDARRGFDVTTNATYDGRGTSRIQRTDDGGASWTTVWSRSRASLDSIDFAGPYGFAAGVTYARCSLGNCRGRPVLLTSDDAGVHWRALRPRGAPESWQGLDFQFVSARVGFAYPDPDGYPWGPPLLRTVDGGRHWTPLSARLAGFDFLDARRGYATGGRGRGSCVFATTDGAASWHVLPSSCRSFSLSSVDFVDGSTGFAAGGLPYYVADKPFQAVLVTHDGGRSWQTVFRGVAERSPGLPIVRLAMADALHGLSATGGCKMGQNGPCGGAVLATRDGGRSWRNTGRSAGRLALAGSAHAWVVPACELGCDMIWQTTDGGRTWQALVRPANAAFSTLEAAGPWLLATGELGTYRSLDGGRSWRPFFAPVPSGTQPWQQRIARPGLDAVLGNQTIQLSHDGGHTWRAAAFPNGISAVAFADREHGLAAQQAFGCTKFGETPHSLLFATGDGGLSWHALPTPSFGIDALAGTPGLWVAETEGAACGQHGIAVSGDSGRTWSSHDLPHLWDCSPSVAPPLTIWLACGVALLTSIDGGMSWTELTARDFEVLDASPGWLVGNQAGEQGTIWQSTDGGRALRVRWPLG
jgi:photosystem II stability/assembly factor-like uncharacterized protein